jgi:RNase P subunit RPR2
VRQEKFLGIPINVVTDEEIAQEAETQTEAVSYIVMRVADETPGRMSPALQARRLRTLCEKCNELCFVDPKCLDSFRPMKVEIICMQCFRKAAGHRPIETTASRTAWNEAIHGTK